MVVDVASFLCTLCDEIDSLRLDVISGFCWNLHEFPTTCSHHENLRFFLQGLFQVFDLEAVAFLPPPIGNNTVRQDYYVVAVFSSVDDYSSKIVGVDHVGSNLVVKSALFLNLVLDSFDSMNI